MYSQEPVENTAYFRVANAINIYILLTKIFVYRFLKKNILLCLMAKE